MGKPRFSRRKVYKGYRVLPYRVRRAGTRDGTHTAEDVASLRTIYLERYGDLQATRDISTAALRRAYEGRMLQPHSYARLLYTFTEFARRKAVAP